MISKKALAITLLTVVKAVVSFVPSKPFTPHASSSSILRAAPPGWKGGFKDSHPEYNYELVQPDLCDLPITGNLDNIDKITRMQKVNWPQFSWQSILGDESSRLYEMFAPDISRIGYDDEGRIWSIICPQRGRFIPFFGTMFLEVTVTGVRGWVDEPSQSAYANMGVIGNIWIEADENPVVKFLSKRLDVKNFPFSKENAAKVRGHALGKPYEEFWPMTNGTDTAFFHPNFAQHWDEAYSVYNLQVEIGKQIMTGDKLVDDFNKLIIELFNIASGNILVQGQKVAWNVWPNEPELVKPDEWRGHADKWYKSIKVDHKYPEGDPGKPTYFDGRHFKPALNLEDVVHELIKEFVKQDEPLRRSLLHALPPQKPLNE